MRGGAFIGFAGIVAVILGFIPPAVAAEDHQAAINGDVPLDVEKREAGVAD